MVPCAGNSRLSQSAICLLHRPVHQLTGLEPLHHDFVARQDGYRGEILYLAKLRRHFPQHITWHAPLLQEVAAEYLAFCGFLIEAPERFLHQN